MTELVLPRHWRRLPVVKVEVKVEVGEEGVLSAPCRNSGKEAFTRLELWVQSVQDILLLPQLNERRK